MSEMFEAAEEVVDELFPPKPGGLVDRHRQRRAANQAREDEERERRERVEESSYKAIKVTPESPEVFTAQTLSIAAGQQASILPANPYRYRAIILVVTAASTVILAKDSSAALGGNGFTLAAGTPLPVYTRAQVYAFNPGGAAVQVSVLAEIYAPEN